MAAETELCPCGKPASHVDADPDVDEGMWACLVPNFDPVTGEHLPPVGKYAPAVSEGRPATEARDLCAVIADRARLGVLIEGLPISAGQLDDLLAHVLDPVRVLGSYLADQAEQNDETLRMSSPGASWRDRHSGLRDAYRDAASRVARLG